MTAAPPLRYPNGCQPTPGAKLVTQVIVFSGTTFNLSALNWQAVQKLDVHPLYGVKIKIARANEHILNIAQTVQAFGRSHRIVREMELHGIHEIVKLLVAPVPEMLPVVVGEVVFHLRSALDNLACCLAIANGKSVKSVYFPIVNSPDEFELPATQRKIKNLSPAAQKLIHRLKPYKGGANLLWAMNRLRNEDIHIRLAPILVNGPHWKTATARVLINAESGGTIEMTTTEAFENEIILARCSRGAKIEYDAEPTIHIAFGDIEFLKGESIVSRLQQMVDLTTRIVDIFERHFF
jgi:hypothetical protein